MWILTAKSESGDDYGPIKKWDQKEEPDSDDVNRALAEFGCDCTEVGSEDAWQDFGDGPNDFEVDGKQYVNYLWPEVWEMK